MASKQMVIFKINEEAFGVEISQVSSIERPLEIFKVPNTPEFIEGLINLRGKIYTVFNLRKKFGFPYKEFDDSTKIVIVNINSVTVGFIVDEVNEITTFEDSDMENTPAIISGLDKKYLSGIAKKGEKIILLLDLVHIISASEKDEIVKLSS